MEHRKIKRRVYACRAAIITVIIVAVNIIMLGSSTFALGDGNESSKIDSDYYIDILGKTMWIFKESENRDDRKLFGDIAFNPLKIMKSEISILEGYNYEGQEQAASSDEQAALNNENIKKASKIVINPFKLKEDAVNKKEASVDVVGNPEDNSKKKVFIYHTHTNEAYAEGNSGLSTTVAAVGDELTSQLEAMGFTVIHDKTIHDIDYNRAYYTSHDTLLNYLNSYGDFDLIIDLHRDSGPAKDRTTAEINGESIARVMFVTATKNPRYSAQLEMLNSIIGTADELYPGLILDKSIYTYSTGIIYYSQDLSDNAMLMEVGTDANELSEAKNSMKYMAVVFAKYLNSK